MQVFTPNDIAQHASNKYLGVLVAAKYARILNENALFQAREKKLTTRALEELAHGDLKDKYHVVPRRRSE